MSNYAQNIHQNLQDTQVVPQDNSKKIEFEQLDWMESIEAARSAALAAQTRRKHSAQTSREETADELTTVSMPIWPEHCRAVPSDMLRCSLFGVVKKGSREFLKNRVICSSGDVVITQTGEQLDQADLDVWEQCMHLARRQKSDTISFSLYSFLKAIGRSTGKQNMEWLKASLERLQGTGIAIRVKSRYYSGNMIFRFSSDAETDRQVIHLNRDIIQLYTAETLTWLDWEERRRLGSKGLAKWLHAFYSSHRAPRPYSVEKLKELCGSESPTKVFKQKLKSALEDLCAVTGWKVEVTKSNLILINKKRENTLPLESD